MALKDLGYVAREAATNIVFDDEARRELDAAATALAQYAQRADGDLAELNRLQERLDAAQAAADATTVVFRFRARSRRAIADLVAECPPSSDQLERWQAQARAQPLVTKAAPEFDWDKFAPRLIAMSMVEPVTDEAEVLAMWNDDSDSAWSDAIWEALWDAAWSVNQQITTRPTFANDSEQT